MTYVILKKAFSRWKTASLVDGLDTSLLHLMQRYSPVSTIRVGLDTVLRLLGDYEIIKSRGGFTLLGF